MKNAQEKIRVGSIVSYQDSLAKVLMELPDNCSQIRIINDSVKVVTENTELKLVAEAPCDDWEDEAYIIFAKKREAASPEEIGLSELKLYVSSLYREKKIKLQAACKMLECKKTTFYKILKKSDSAYGAAVLIRDIRGRKSGTKTLSHKQEIIIRKAISMRYKGKAASYAEVYRTVKDLCAEEDIDKPSRNAVVERIKEIPEKISYRLKNGAEAAAEKFGAKPRKLATKRALEVFQMDHTLVDLIICDEGSRTPIGRPWLTLVMDVHTRVIVGYYISLHSPSTVSVASAVTFSIMPKHDLMESIGCGELNFPFYGKPEALHLDNAAEFKTLAFQKACSMHKIKLNWRPIGKKHYGGHVERLIGTLMIGQVHLLPGTTFSNVQQRKGYDSEKKSALTLKEFGIWFARQVVLYNGSKHSSLRKSPADAWLESTKGLEQKIPTREEIFRFRLDFMPEDTRCITPKGISFKCRNYYSPALCQHIGLKKAQIKYDPYSLKRIWVRVDGSYIDVPYSDATTDDRTLEEYYAETIARTQIEPTTWLPDLRTASIRKENYNLVASATTKTKKTRKSAISIKEYADYTSSTFPAPLDTNVRTPAIDYSERLIPFRSDD